MKEFSTVFQRETDRIILSNFTPPGVVVNEHLEILLFRGKTGLFLEPASGAPSFNLMKMSRDSTGVKLRLAIERAKNESKAVEVKEVDLRRNGEKLLFDSEVRPFQIPTNKDDLFLILVKEIKPAAKPQPVTRAKSEEEEKDKEIGRLRKELDETKSYPQSYTSENEANNEELHATTEELQASYKELQSINEWLQTAREELQASNEELRTVNEELANRNVELNDQYNLLENLINSTNIVLRLPQPVENPPLLGHVSQYHAHTPTSSERSGLHQLSPSPGRVEASIWIDLPVLIASRSFW